jgi:NitT/TauT family transport system substrate-binding protein
MTRRRFLRLLAGGTMGLALGAAGCGGAKAPAAAPSFCGPALAETLPLLRLRREMLEHGEQAEFTPWQSPDQLRALVAGGGANAAVLSLASAAVLLNRGVDLRVASLSMPPLWIVTTGSALGSLADIDGQDICLPFGPGETPDLLLRGMARRAGITIAPRHCGGALEAVNLLFAGRASHAFLGEPAASLAEARSLRQPEGSRIRRGLDMREAWAGLFPESPQLIHGAFAVFGPLCRDAATMRKLGAGYARGAAQVAQDPREAARIAAEDFPALAEQALDGIVPGSDLRLAKGPRARDAGLFFLAMLHQDSPDSIGGGMPPAGFIDTEG